MTDQPDQPVEVFVGIDVGKTDHYAQAFGTAGELFDGPVANDEAAIEALIARASEHGQPALVIDQPGSYGQLILAVAARTATPVAYVTGLQMRRAADLYAGAAKTDPRDAWVLADFAQRHVDQLVWLEVTDELLARLRILNGRDVDLAEDANRIANRTRDALVSVSPALERALGEHLDKPGVRDLLSRYPTPTALRAAGKARIHKTITRRSPRMADKITTAVGDALDAQTVTLPSEHTYGTVIADLVGDLERIAARRNDLAAEIEEAFSAHPLGPVLVSLCGIGPRTGSRILAEIGDPARFATGARLAAYAGLAPIDRRSGRTLNGTSRNRGGNHRLKNALFITAFVAAQHDPVSRAYYQRKRAEGKGHNAAVICLARRRCDTILAMLKTATPWDANRHQTPPDREKTA
jgi:transposase